MKTFLIHSLGDDADTTWIVNAKNRKEAIRIKIKGRNSTKKFGRNSQTKRYRNSNATTKNRRKNKKSFK